MTAVWVGDLPDVDDSAPIGWSLTAAGWLGTLDTLDVAQAAAVLGLSEGSVRRLARCGAVRGMQVDSAWVLDRVSVEDHRAELDERHAGHRRLCRLPAGPLLELVDARGGPRAVGIPRDGADDMALYRARKSGRLSERAADRIVTRWLGMTPWEVWGDLYC